MYSSLEEFQGIKRLNIFKFHEDKNMLLPVETEFDVENGLLYAEVDELGTYCIMDMEIWLNNLGVEMPKEIKHEENAMYLNSPSILSASEDSGSVWTPTYVNLPIDLVFILQSAGTSSSNFDTEKQLIIDFASSVIKDYSNVKITVIEFKKDKANLLTDALGRKYFTNIPMLFVALNNIEYDSESDYCDRGQAFKILFNDISLNYGNNIYVYKLVNGATTSHTIYDNEDVISKVKNNEVRAYSEVMPYGWHYVESSTHTRISNEIAANKDLFITLNSNTLSAMKTHFPTKLSPAKPVYDIIVPTKWKKISLDGELNPNNNIDTDGDTLTDWEEVDTERLIWNEDGSFEIPTYNIAELTNNLIRFQSSDYNFLYDELKNKLPRHYLPIFSDPTEEDSDGDGILDPDEYTNLTTDSRYDNIDPLKADTIETLYPELTRNSKTNVDTNPIYLDINNNTIILKVKYKLNDKAYESSNIMKPDSTEYYTNEEIIIKSISDKWNTEIQGNIFDFYPGMSIKVKIELKGVIDGKYIEFIIGDDGDNYTLYEDNIWNTNKISYVKLSTKNKKGKDLDEVNRFAAPAHEIGHTLGLGDLYGYSNNSNWRLQPVIYDISKTTQNEIWYNYSKNNPDGDLMHSFGLVRANDIEMILQAYCDNQEQYFRPEFDKENKVSKAIKEYQGNIYLDRYNKEFVIYDSKSKTTTSIGDADVYQTYLKDNYGINVTITELEEIYGRDNITSS